MQDETEKLFALCENFEKGNISLQAENKDLHAQLARAKADNEQVVLHMREQCQRYVLESSRSIASQAQQRVEQYNAHFASKLQAVENERIALNHHVHRLEEEKRALIAAHTKTQQYLSHLASQSANMFTAPNSFAVHFGSNRSPEVDPAQTFTQPKSALSKTPDVKDEEAAPKAMAAPARQAGGTSFMVATCSRPTMVCFPLHAPSHFFLRLPSQNFMR